MRQLVETAYQKKKRREVEKKQAAAERRKQFKGMTDEEIRNFIPKNESFLYESVTDSSFIGIVVKNCCICGKKHFHGSRMTSGGIRESHCNKYGEEAVPNYYQLVIDWSRPENKKLKSRHSKLYGA